MAAAENKNAIVSIKNALVILDAKAQFKSNREKKAWTTALADVIAKVALT